MFNFNDLKYLQYIKPFLIGLIGYMFLMTLIVFLILFNVIDIHTIVENMKNCTHGVAHLLGA